MAKFILANIETKEEKAYPRDDDQPVIGLQEPPWYVLEVIREPMPDILPGETAVQTRTQDFENGQLIYGWRIEQLPPPGPDYQKFYDGLIASQVYASVVSTQGKTGDQAAAMTVFLGAIQDAKSGRENVQALQAAIWLLLSEITLSQEGYAELQELMEQYRLAGVYQLEAPQ